MERRWMTKDDQDGVDNEKIWFCLLFPLYRETTKDRFEDYTDLLDKLSYECRGPPGSTLIRALPGR